MSVIQFEILQHVIFQITLVDNQRGKNQGYVQKKEEKVVEKEQSLAVKVWKRKNVKRKKTQSLEEHK